MTPEITGAELIGIKPVELLRLLENHNVKLWLENETLKFRAPQGVMTKEVIEQLKRNKDDCIALLKERELSQTLTVTTDLIEKSKPFPLSDVQSAYLIGRQNVFDYGGTGCHGYFEIQFNQLDHHRLEFVWNRLIERHDMLRAIILPNGTQQILPEVPAFHIECRTEENARGQFRTQMSHRVYETDQWPLFDLKVTQENEAAYLHFSIDLLIADFLSIQILFSELVHLYHAPELALTPMTVSYRDVMEYEQSQKLSHKYGLAKEYWAQRIPDLPAAPQLPEFSRVSGNADVPLDDMSPKFKRHEMMLSPEEWQLLETSCQKQGITPSSLLLTLYAEVIARWSDNAHFCLNMTVMNRDPIHEDLQKMVGDFTSVNVLEVDLRTPSALIERVKSQQAQLWQDLEHKSFTGIEVMRELARQKGIQYARMPVVFTSALVGGKREQVSETRAQYDMGMEMVFGISQTPQVWIDCQIMLREQNLCVNWDVLEGVFPQGMIDSMFTAYETAIRQLIRAKASLWQKPLAISLPDSQQSVRQRVNDTRHEFPDVMLHELVLAQAERTPESPAVVLDEVSLSYRELVDASRAIAAQLPSGIRIAVAMPKSTEQIVATLAVLMADSAYVPIDVGLPAVRISQILSNAEIDVVLTVGEALDVLPDVEKYRVIDCLSPDWSLLESIDSQSISETTERLAYIIYTSGSTGVPKGVMISHRSAVNTVLEINRRFGITEQDTILGLARLSFDLSVYDVFGAFATGAKLMLLNESDLKNPATWARVIERNQVTVWNSVPAQMNMLTRYLADEPELAIDSLRVVMMSGDWIPIDLPGVIYQSCPRAMVYSLGGATEAAIWSIFYPIHCDLRPCDPKESLTENLSSIPYGTPLANQQFTVLNSSGDVCPDWVAGELCIGGDGVAQGYWDDAEKTDRHFYRDEKTGIPWYRTGDRGYYRQDGVLIFVGRQDNQLKIRGHRIELGDIESAIESQKTVSQAAVIARGEKQTRYLQAYVQPGIHAESAARKNALQRFGHSLEKLSQFAEQIRSSLSLPAIEQFAHSLDRVALLHMSRALQVSAGLQAVEVKTLDQIMNDGAYAARHKPLVNRWLNALVKHRLVERVDQCYRLVCTVQTQEIQHCWDECYHSLSLLDGDKGLVDYLERSSQCLPELLKDLADPLDLLFPDGNLDVAVSAYQKNLLSEIMNKMLIFAALDKVTQLNAQGNKVRILEIGAGVGGTSNELIPALAGKNISYVFTDVSPFFLNAAKERYQQYDFVEYQLYDFNQGAIEQQLDCGQFDIIVSSNVLHNAVKARTGLNHLRELLAPEGWLLVIEATRDNYQLMTSMEFKHGLTEYQDERLELQSPFMPQQNWLQAMQDVGAEQTYAFPSPDETLHLLGQSFIVAQFNSGKLNCHKAEVRAELERTLPHYMVPNDLIIVDSLPLTANGKIARQQLPVIESVTSVDDVTCPDDLDTLESVLLKTCRMVIGNPTMSVTDDFFSAGGDSLLITQWISRIREELGDETIPWESSLRQVLVTPSVRGLATFLRQEMASGDQSDRKTHASLTQIKSGSGEPIIVVHDGSGTVMPCLQLIEQLNSPVYGLQVVDSQHYLSMPEETLITDLAHQYLSILTNELELKQCHIFGFCMGGLIAFEIARQALEGGQSVGSLTIASSYQIPYKLDDPMMIDLALVKELGIDIPWSDINPDELEVVYLHLMEQRPAKITVNDVVDCAGTMGFTQLAGRYPGYANAPMEQRIAYFNVGLEYSGSHASERDCFENNGSENHRAAEYYDLTSIYPVFHHSVKAVCSYNPGFYCGDLMFACQKDATYLLPSLKADMQQFWKKHCIGDIDVMTLEGDHFSCLQQASVLPLATFLNQLSAQSSVPYQSVEEKIYE